MNFKDWNYYNHAAMPTTSLGEEPDMSPIESGDIWKMDGSPLLARWTSDFDCGVETNWWYVIKDTPFDISGLKAKRRYEINKGIKNFEIRVINPQSCKDEMYEVQQAAFLAYPSKYRPKFSKQAFSAHVDDWGDSIVFGAFSFESGEMCGWALAQKDKGNCINLWALKAKPECEKLGINAAIVYGVLQYFDDFIAEGGYICDGARNINHESAFQDYLEKYFEFRKAYCKLHIVYNPKIKPVINLLFPFRRMLLRLDGIGIIHSINAVLRMEGIYRERS